MKTLKVPFISRLAQLQADVLADVLESGGVLQSVDSTPWAEFPYKPETTIRVAADESHLFVRFRVRGLGLKAEFTALNEPVWQDSCVEVFLATADGLGYRNFEVNCIGNLLSAYQTGRGIGTMPVTAEQASTVIRYASESPRAFSEIAGEHSWSVTIGIPFGLLGYDRRPDSLRGNFYKCADGCRLIHYVSWAPIDTAEPDFHRPEFFGILELEPITA